MTNIEAAKILVDMACTIEKSGYSCTGCNEAVAVACSSLLRNDENNVSISKEDWSEFKDACLEFSPHLDNIKQIFNDIQEQKLVYITKCKDCTHKGWIQEPCHGRSVDYCNALEHVVDENFFCAQGEPKKENKNA